KELLGQSVPQARQMLRKVLVGRLPCEGFAEAGQRGYRFKGNRTYGRLFAGIASGTSGGDPGGIRTRDLDLERVASWARLDDGVSAASIPGPGRATNYVRAASRPTCGSGPVARRGTSSCRPPTPAPAPSVTRRRGFRSSRCP